MAKNAKGTSALFGNGEYASDFDAQEFDEQMLGGIFIDDGDEESSQETLA